jgi:hypothetical protein
MKETKEPGEDWPKYPTDEERAAYLEKTLKADLQRIEDLNRQELEKLGLPTEVQELRAALGKMTPHKFKRRPRDQDVPETVKRGWSIHWVLAIAIPQTLRHAKEGNAYLAGRWALRTAFSGQFGDFAARGLAARVQSHKAARSAKYCRGIRTFIDGIVAEHPTVTVSKLLSQFHTDRDEISVIGDDGRDYRIYRNDEELVQVDDVTGQEKSLKPKSLEPYLRQARNKASRRSADSAG